MYRIARKFGGLAIYMYITTAKLKSAIISYSHIHMAILYRTANFKSANILAIVIWAQSPNLIPANISGYTVYTMSLHFQAHSQSFNVSVYKKVTWKWA